MFKRWWLVHYLATYKEEGSSNSIHDVHVKRFDLVLYLVTIKHFREDWRFTFIRWFHWIERVQVPDTKFYSRLSVAQFKEVEDTIDNCLADKLIQTHTSPAASNRMAGDTYLWADHKSREFLTPLVFMTAVSDKYGPLKSGFIGAVIASIIWLITYIYKP